MFYSLAHKKYLGFLNLLIVQVFLNKKFAISTFRYLHIESRLHRERITNYRKEDFIKSPVKTILPIRDKTKKQLLISVCIQIAGVFLK